MKKIDSNKFVILCKKLIHAYESGLLGQTKMPEDNNPGLSKMSPEDRIAYFSLPMALNYQRDSYKLWEAANKTFKDPRTNFVFDIKKTSNKNEQGVRKALTKYKLALQPNKHTYTWITISKTIHKNWGSFLCFFQSSKNDFSKIKQITNIDYKKGFPYLSGPKIFNYWSFIISTYGGVKLLNRNQIEIAPDTHITKCSIKLGIITEKESESLTKDEISNRWRNLLKDSGIDPIDMHSPLWFWSKNGFIYNLE